MKSIALTGALLFAFVPCHAQQAAAPAANRLTEKQTASLKVAQLEAMLKQEGATIAQQQVQIAQLQLQLVQREQGDAMASLNQIANVVKGEHGWPKETAFDPNTLEFTLAPANRKP